MPADWAWRAILGLALRGVAAQETERVVRERHRLLEVLLDIQRSISHRKPLSDVLAAITAGASGLLGGCPVALVLDDPLDPERPIVAATTAGGERSESELADRRHRRGAVGERADIDTALAASVHINGARAGALVAMAPSARPSTTPSSACSTPSPSTRASRSPTRARSRPWRRPSTTR